MADQTLTINNADGSSKTYTINRDKFAGVSSMQVNGQTVTVDRTAVPKEQDRETTFGGTQSITVKRGIDPLLNKVVGGAAAAYSLRDLNDKQGNNKVVRVRRSSDDAEKDFLGNDIDKVADWVNGKQETTLPCDVASAAAAYSLRPVNSNYTGNIVRVRRSSDNAEQDFSDVSLIADWVGLGNDGYVTTWYDQSGNGNNATQSTASSQPKIVDAGVLVSDGIDFDGVDDFFNFTNGLNFYNNPCSLFATCGVSNGPLLGNDNNRRVVFNSNELYFYLTGLAQDFDHNQAPLSGLNQFSVIHNGTSTSPNSSAYLNSVENNPTSLNDSSALPNDSTIFIGKNTGVPTLSYDSSISEIIIYDSDQSANRFKIESNINNHYGLYTNANDGFVTTWYDQSGNSNDATQSTAASQPKIVDAGVLVSDGIKFDGVDDEFETSAFISGSTSSFFSLLNCNDLSATEQQAWNFTDGGSQYYGLTFNRGAAGNVGFSATNPSVDLGEIGYSGSSKLFSTFSATQSKYFSNGIESSSTVLGRHSPTTGNTIGSQGSSGRYLDGTISEIIIYNSDQSANRAAIETNINNYYDIY